MGKTTLDTEAFKHASLKAHTGLRTRDDRRLRAEGEAGRSSFNQPMAYVDFVASIPACLLNIVAAHSQARSPPAECPLSTRSLAVSTKEFTSISCRATDCFPFYI